MVNRITPPIPQDRIGESFVWREWFQRLSDRVFGSLANQDSNDVNITGGTITGISFTSPVITGGSINGTTIGLTVPAASHFTSTQLDTPLAVPYGGTGLQTLPINTVLLGNATSNIASTTVGATNTALVGNTGAAPTFGAITEAHISLSNNTTNNATVGRHGFLPILSGVATQFLDGNGSFATPAGTAASYKLQSFSAVTSVNVLHNFGTYPIVQVIDNIGAVFIPLTIVHNTVNDFTVTFTAATTGNVMASVGSPQPQSVVSTAADYLALTTDRIIKVTAAGKTVTLYTAVGNTGRELIINNASSGTCTTDGDGTETISGVLTQTLPSRSSMVIYSDGANWQII